MRASQKRPNNSMVAAVIDEALPLDTEWLMDRWHEAVDSKSWNKLARAHGLRPSNKIVGDQDWIQSFVPDTEHPRLVRVFDAAVADAIAEERAAFLVGVELGRRIAGQGKAD